MVTDEATLKRQKRFREKRRQEGQRRIAVWLSREGVDALETLKRLRGGATEASIIDDLLQNGVSRETPADQMDPLAILERVRDLLQAFRHLKPDIQLHAILALASLANRPTLEMDAVAREVGKSRLVTIWDLQDFQPPPLGRNASLGLVDFDPPLGSRDPESMALTPEGEAFARKLGRIMMGEPEEKPEGDASTAKEPPEAGSS